MTPLRRTLEKTIGKVESKECRPVLLSPEPSNLGGEPSPGLVKTRYRGTECLGLVPILHI